MSTLTPVESRCKTCREPVHGEVVQVANFDRRNDLRQQVLDGSFNRRVCAACGHQVVVKRTVATFDFGRQSWIYCYPSWAEKHWKDLAKATDAAFRRNMVLSAPPSLRGWSTAMHVRVVFGYDALREQMLLQDYGLDPLAVEYAKVALLAGDVKRAMHRLLLWRVESDGALTWLATSATEAITRTTSPSILDAERPAELPASDLQSDAFVSYRRWVVSPRPADPLAFDLDGIGHLHAGGAVLRRPFDDNA